MLGKRVAAIAAATILTLSMGATTMATGLKPINSDLTAWNNMPTGDTAKLCVETEPGTNPNGSIRSADGYIRYKTPDNCGPWYYEDVEADIKKAFDVDELVDRGRRPPNGMTFHILPGSPDELRDEPNWISEDSTGLPITVSNGTQVAKPGNGVKIRPHEYLYANMDDTWMQIMPGDVDNSGTITISDLTEWLQCYRVREHCSTMTWLACDLNGDKDLSLSDLVMLAGILAKGPNTRTFDGKPATPAPAAKPLRMEYEPVYESVGASICWHCGEDMIEESKQTGKLYDVVRGEHGARHNDEYFNGTARRPNYFYYNADTGVLMSEGSYTAFLVHQVDVVPAPAEAHARHELICGVCDLNITRELIDPEEHRMQHVRENVEFGGIGFIFYRGDLVWVPAA